jgi:hypothetical protein
MTCIRSPLENSYLRAIENPFKDMYYSVQQSHSCRRGALVLVHNDEDVRLLV